MAHRSTHDPETRARLANVLSLAEAVAFFGKPESVSTPAPAAAPAIGLLRAKDARTVPIADVPISSTAVVPACVVTAPMRAILTAFV